MALSLLITLIALLGGTATTYLYDSDSPFAARLCAGAYIGLAALGLVVFVLACFIGLSPLSIAIGVCIVALPLLLLRDPARKRRFIEDYDSMRKALLRALTRPSIEQTGTVLFFAAFAVLMWFVFDRVMFEQAGNIYTGELNNYGDLPFHISVITSFAKGNNFPPEDPTFTGVRFTYPFIADLIAAIFVRVGADLRDAMFLENLVLAVSTVGLLYRFGLVLTRDKLAGIFTTLLVIFSGGMGWLKLFRDMNRDGKGLFEMLAHLPQAEYTIIPSTILRWGNMISSLLFTQRSFLLGLPIALIVFTEWWKIAFDGDVVAMADPQPQAKGRSKRKDRERAPAYSSPVEPDDSHSDGNSLAINRTGASRLFFALIPRFPLSNRQKRMFVVGLVAGLLPLVHAHTFVAMMVVGLVLMLLSGVRRWSAWTLFFAGATIVGGPQMLWAVMGTAVRSGMFFGFEFGWDRGNENVLWFWLVNCGIFIPLLIIALAWRGKNPIIPRRLLLFYLPFTLCFVIPNSVKLAPWIWDNIKVLIYWWVASAPIVALLLAKLWRKGPVWGAISLALLAVMSFAGALDVYRIASGQTNIQEFDRAGVEFAKMIEANTPSNALILHATTHNHPLFLTGRRSLMGYPGHIWTHGLDPAERQRDIRVMYAGGQDAEPLMKENNVQYVIVSSIENGEMNVNNLFFEQKFTRIGQVGDYRLYKVTP
jgi:hypothetical protein